MFHRSQAANIVELSGLAEEAGPANEPPRLIRPSRRRGRPGSSPEKPRASTQAIPRVHLAEIDTPPGSPPTARAWISAMRNPDRFPVYTRAAAGTSPVVACPPAATPRGHVHQWINAFQPNNRARLCKLVQRPRPSQAGQVRSASHSVVTTSDLDPASDPGRRASLHWCPRKRRTISAGVHYSPRCSTPTKRGDTETARGRVGPSRNGVTAPSGRHQAPPVTP